MRVREWLSGQRWLCWSSWVPRRRAPSGACRWTPAASSAARSRATPALACWGTNGQGQATPPPGASAPSAPAAFTRARSGAVTGASPAGAATALGQLNNVPAGGFTAIAAGANHTCALRADGSVALLGRSRRWAVGRPGRDLHRRQRGCGAYVRDQDRRHGRLLGRELQRAVDCASRHIQRRERGPLHHLRDQERRHRRVLGLQRQPAGHAAGRDLQRRHGRRQSLVRCENERQDRVLGLRRLWRAAGGELHRGHRQLQSHVRGQERRRRRRAGAPEQARSQSR